MSAFVVQLPECACGSSLAAVGAAAAPHQSSLRCDCGASRGAISLVTATFAATLAAKPGAPGAIKIRRLDWQPPTPAVRR